MQKTIRLQSLPFGSVATYLAAMLFIIGNLALPQLFHRIPQGGVTWLPIYFFTLVGAYSCGWRVGVLAAVLSPLANALLFGMPAVEALPAIVTKSLLLALMASYAAWRFRRAQLWIFMVVVLGYQLTGTLAEWLIKGDFYLACQDFRIGIPGMILQIVGGWLAVNAIMRR
ncbi:MAG: ECF transporter S component [Muribaculaceae bacterium]|nr:ECF transporter S component [Muribaculaceae bacterium]